MRTQCAWCLKEKLGTGVWIDRNEKLSGTHGICPACYKKLHDELDAETAAGKFPKKSVDVTPRVCLAVGS